LRAVADRACSGTKKPSDALSTRSEGTSMKFSVRAALLCVALLAGCRGPEQEGNRAQADASAPIAPVLTTPDAVDPHSFARPAEARVTHVALDLGVDFAAKRLGGTARLDIQRRPDARQIILDSNGLEIESITGADGAPLQWQVGAKDPNLGAPLAVALKPDTQRILIRYKSAPEAGALQWLTPEQTSSRKGPFLFSQGQAIENRSWIPTQDSPGIRQTWEATSRTARSARGPASGPSRRCSLPPRTNWPTPRRWSRPPKGCSGLMHGAATTFWSCRRPSRSAAWKTP
jgi:hypothetical protein